MYQKEIVGRIDEYAFKKTINDCNKVFIICGSAYKNSRLKQLIDSWNIPKTIYSAISPNPAYEQIVEAVHQFQNEKCDAVLAVGGGSILDAAKCVKLFGRMNAKKDYLQQEYGFNDIRLIAIPTTAGTGSEATRFAVIYVNGEKKSIEHDSILPEVVFLDSSLIKSVPEYQRVSTMLDALCHAVESLWSVNSNEESVKYSLTAMQLLWKWKEAYLKNEEAGNANMLLAANYAGKAINIAKTTACHAMCYKLTTYYGIPHGCAAAMCLPGVYEVLKAKEERRINKTEKAFLVERMKLLEALGIEGIDVVIEYVEELLSVTMEGMSVVYNEEIIDKLVNSVNTERLKNSPYTIAKNEMRKMYVKLIKKYLL